MKADCSLCIINRDDRANLERLVAEARPWVEEIVVVDTGSLDGSPLGAFQRGANTIAARPALLHEDGDLRSFAEARNEAFSLATRPWRFWLDTDDTLVDGGWFDIKHLVEVATETRKTSPRLCVQLEYDYAPGTVYSRDRFVHVDDGWTWQYPVHEQLHCTKGEPTYFKDHWYDGPKVFHLSRGSRGVTNERNYKILKRWAAEPGEKPDTFWFCMGEELFYRNKYEEALKCFGKGAGTKNDVQLRSSLFTIRTLHRMGRTKEVGPFAKLCIEARRDVANFYDELASIQFMLGNAEQALYLYDLAGKAPYHLPGEPRTGWYSKMPGQ